MAGIHQAGWRHKLLIRGLFAGAFAFILVGILWHWIKNYSPDAITKFISDTATNGVAWFVILIFALALVLFRKPVTLPSLVAHAQDEPYNPVALTQKTCPLTLLEAFLEMNNSPNITYKRKLRIILRNDSQKLVTIRAASWERRNRDDIEQKPQDRYLWQIEQTLGSWDEDRWKPGELMEIPIPPGYAVWTYIGVNDQATHRGVGRRLVQGRLGILVLLGGPRS